MALEKEYNRQKKIEENAKRIVFDEKLERIQNP